MERDNGARRKAGNVWRIALAAAALLTLADADFTVKAAPVSLEDSSAVVYEQTSEESSALGNLIQGSTFDYQGDVTAEDGSVWRLVTMTNGVAGYIRGDIAFSAVETTGGENGDTGAAGEENGAAQPDAGAAAAEENETAAAEAVSTENAVTQTETAGTGNTGIAAGNTAEEEEAAEDDETAGEEDTLAGDTANIISGVENSREKTYAIDSGEVKVKQKESQTEGKEAAETSAKESFFGRLDKTLIFSGLVLLCAAAAGVFFFGRMKKEYAQLDRSWNDGLGETAYRHDRKHENRRQRNRRKKGKKQQVKKEYEKLQRPAEGKETERTRVQKK